MSSTAPTQTLQNLHSSYLGETQARAQYLAAADHCDQARLHVLAHAFRFTAAQEKEHAAIFRGLLTAQGGSLPVLPQSAPPLPKDPSEMLAAVIQSEGDESGKLYPAYARIARQEGFPRVATAFLRIAETEQLHARRFQQFQTALQEGTLFRNESRVGWLCLPCGHLHYGSEAPENCSTCGRSRDHFIRSNFHPFTLE